MFLLKRRKHEIRFVLAMTDKALTKGQKKQPKNAEK